MGMVRDMPKRSVKRSVWSAPGGVSRPLDAALSRVGDRWSLLLVEVLLDGPCRFSKLEAALPGIASNVLAQRLKRLEREGVVGARPYSERVAPRSLARERSSRLCAFEPVK
jgi:DNA-binding HxlR family transcriptional regulator